MSPIDEQGRIEKHEHRYAGYEAQDQKGERIGYVDDLFVDTVDRQEYVELNMGFLGLSSTLIPVEICEVDDGQKIVHISQSRTRLRRAPRKKEALLSDDDIAAITPEYEDRVREYYGLEKRAHPPASGRPASVFSSAYPKKGDIVDEDRTSSGRPVEGEASRLRPVEYRVLDRTPVEPGSGAAAGSRQEEPAATPVDGLAGDAPDVPTESVVVSDEAAAAVSTPPAAAAAVPTEDALEETESPGEAAETVSVGAGEGVGGEAVPEIVERETVEVGPEPGWTGDAEAAVSPMADTVRQYSRMLEGRASEFGEGNTRLIQDLSASFAGRVREGTEKSLQTARDLQEQGLRQQRTSQAALAESVGVYAGFLGSAITFYQQSLLTAAQVTVSGVLSNLQATARVAQRNIEASKWATGENAPDPGQPASETGSATGSPETAGRDTMPGSAGGSAEQEISTPGNAGSSGVLPATTPDDEAAGGGDVPAGNAGAVGEQTSATGAGTTGGTAPEGETDESLEEVMEPPPAIPDILDELPPAPQAPPSEDLPDVPRT